MSVDVENNLRNYDILNSIVPAFYKKKFPYNIVRATDPEVELTHKKVELEYIKGKNYFATPDQASKWKRGGVYGGDSGKITVFFF